LTLRLLVLESRPKSEGISFVNTLLDPYRKDPSLLRNMEIEIASDPSTATALEGADYLVLGGDKVLPNGDISNKIGSLTATMLVRTMSTNCKAVTAFDTDKIGWKGDIPETEYNNPVELTDVWPLKVAEQVKAGSGEGV
jgi:translation initiation factor 2B subunit (eIF-2B alpha/beta/delta family)